jgi:hypothetical protein
VSDFPLPFDTFTDLLAFDISGLSGTGYYAASIAGGPSALFSSAGGPLVFVGNIGTGQFLRGLAAPVGSNTQPTGVPDTGGSLGLLFGGLLALGFLRRVTNLRVT